MTTLQEHLKKARKSFTDKFKTEEEFKAHMKKLSDKATAKRKKLSTGNLDSESV